jgi:hypothetical protein
MGSCHSFASSFESCDVGPSPPKVASDYPENFSNAQVRKRLERRLESRTREKYLKEYEAVSYASGLTIEHARDVCSRLMYAWVYDTPAYRRTDPARAGFRVMAIVEYAPGSAAYEALVRSTDSEAFYHWREVLSIWSDYYTDD